MAIGVPEDYVFVAEGEESGGGLEIFDLVAPSTAFAVTAEDGVALAADRETVFVADEEGGVDVFDSPSCVKRHPAPRRSTRRVSP